MKTQKHIIKPISFSIAVIFLTSFFSITKPLFDGSFLINTAVGIVFSIIFALLLNSLDSINKKITLKETITLFIGLLVGMFAAGSLCKLFQIIIMINSSGLSSFSPFFSLFNSLIYIASIHFGIIMMFSLEEKFHLSIPFVKLSEKKKNKKLIILTDSALLDPRIYDFLCTGILNSKLILPKFIQNHALQLLNSSDESMKACGKKLTESIEKILALDSLHLVEDAEELKNISDNKKRIEEFAKENNYSILSPDNSSLAIKDKSISCITLNAIESSLKNTMSSGECIEIKVQRFGKEPKQGVGYLDDGTMVVINNGGCFIGEVIETQVISVKQTSAGRIIFTNALEAEDDGEYTYDQNSVYEHQHD